jgi:8-oxo-dGTP pyrophosphatase MutT (NUDIX family)
MAENSRAHVTVAVVVQRDGKFLLVEERASDQLGAPLVLNQPAGHWDEGETLVAGAAREALEETGWTVAVTGLIGVYDHTSAGAPHGYLRFAFAAEALHHDPDRPLDHGITRALWLSRADVLSEQARHRSPMVLRCIDDALAGRHLPLDVITHL